MVPDRRRPPRRPGARRLAPRRGRRLLTTLISDLGGVVVDFDFDLAYAHWGDALGISPHAIVFPFRDPAYLEFERGRATVAELVERLARDLGETFDEEVFSAGWGRVFTGVNRAVVDLYRELADAGTRIVALTNTNDAHMAVWSRAFAAELEVFGAVYASSRIGARKPDAEAYLHVLEAERIDPDEAVFVDDTSYCVEGAEAVGIESVRFRDAEQLRRDLRAAGLGC